MRGMNKVMLVGRVGMEPELRQGQSGNPWMRLSLATGRAVRKDGDWDEATDWHRVHLFGKNAERCMQRVRKGSTVGVEGQVAYEEWTDDSGAKRRTARVLADRVHFIANLREAPAEAK